MGRVSIGLPFLNSAGTLAAAIRSVFAQTFQDWELILVDDGSSDGSLEMAQQIRDRRVRVITDGLNRGLPHRLNQIAALARYEYLARMDADDIMHPDRLNRQVAYLDTRPNLEVLGSAAYVMDERGGVFGIRGQLAGPPDLRRVIAHGLFIHPTVIARTRWFQSNAYDAAYPRAEDHELWARTFSQSAFEVLNEPLLFYREHLRAGKKYGASCRTDRKILRSYGLPEFGVVGTALAIVRSYAKTGAYNLGVSLGERSERMLLARRNRVPSNEEQQSASTALGVVSRTRLPGLD